MRWIVESGARLNGGGAEPVSGLVLPDSSFFPDDFKRSAKGLRKLLRRVVKLAGMSDFAIRSNLVVEQSEQAGGGGCSTGACGIGGGSGGSKEMRRVEQTGEGEDGGWQVNVAGAELGNPTMLTTALVRALSHIFMVEAELQVPGRDAEAVVDLCGVALGFGVLLCNGAYIYKKG